MARAGYVVTEGLNAGSYLQTKIAGSFLVSFQPVSSAGLFPADPDRYLDLRPRPSSQENYRI